MFKKLLGDPNKRVISAMEPIVTKVNALEPEFGGVDDAALRETTVQLRAQLEGGATLDDVLPRAFAAVREAARRTLGQRHYDVQLIGGIVLHRGQIAEMRTGEGKTLTSTLPVYLNALTGRGVHVITVNDYLSRRDAAWMGRVYAALGLTVGCINHEQAYLYDVSHRGVREHVDDGEQGSNGDAAGDATGVFRVAHDFLRPVSRSAAYRADITYGTNNEFGFDYLRDNMVNEAERMVQRDHVYAIVDEVDSILIDEARTPLIISAPAEGADAEYQRFATLVRKLERETHYTVDEKLRAVSLTEDGIGRVEQLLGIENIYAQGTRLVHHLEQALRSQVLYQRDRDYVIRDDEVIIVDEFTGRLMQGRRYSEGLHQAIEAKEGVTIQRESQTLATITFQNYFRLYVKLAGMTGTAATEAEEFSKIYGLEVVTIPTNRPMVRLDRADRIYRTNEAKLRAVVAEVRERHERGQPILIGTISIEKNEELDALLTREGIPHETLNAKQHEREGEVIAQAGRKGAVTLATNMAGRGVDVILGGNPPSAEGQQDVRQLGGLHVIGTERHESRRIDNQLRGRAGRQGDPGSSQFFVSLEDDLMRIFGGERLKGIMTRLGVPDDVPIENRIVSKQIEAAQRKVEHHHFDTRKHLLEYDDVLNKHREVIYRKRREALSAPDLLPVVSEFIGQEAERIVGEHTPGDDVGAWNLAGLAQAIASSIPLATSVIDVSRGSDTASISRGKLPAAERRTTFVEQFIHAAHARLHELQQKIPQVSDFQLLLRSVVLRAMDQLWLEHLEAIEHLRAGIGLRGYGQRDPLVEYKREAYRLFMELLGYVQHDIVRMLMHAAPAMEAQSVFAQRDVQFAGAQKTMERGRQLVSMDTTGGKEETRSAKAPKRIADAASVEIPQHARDGSGQKVGRNDPCPCGSGKKYKRCHGV